eukprot:gene10872-3488_t
MNLVFKKPTIEVSPKEILENYVVKFNSIFKEKEMQFIFQSFLKTEYDEGGFEFLLEVKKLDEKKRKIPETIGRVLQIFDKYIKVGSEKELNLDFKTREEILSKLSKSGQEKDLKEWKFEEPPEKLFHSVFELLFLDITFEKKSRFIRTEEFLDFAVKNFQNENIFSKRDIQILDYKDENFLVTAFTEKDRKFYTTLCSDNYDWDLFYKKNGTHAYCSQRDYLPNVSFFNLRESVCLKWEWTVPFSIEDVTKIHFHDVYAFRKGSASVTNFDLQLTMTKEEQIKALEKRNMKEVVDNTGIAIYSLHIATPNGNMISPGLSTLYFDGDGIAYVWKCCESLRPNEESLKRYKGDFYVKRGKKKEDVEYVVAMIAGQYKFTKIGRNKTQVTCTAFQNFGVPPGVDMMKFSKKFGEKRAAGLRVEMIKDIKKEISSMPTFEYDDIMGKQCLKALEDFQLYEEAHSQ